MVTSLNSLASILRISGVTEASLSAADLIFAGTVNQSIVGTAGNDHLFGAGGNDVINGLAGNDRLFGENDNDTLIGGLGSDVLFGGLGNDTYALEGATDGISDSGGTADRITSTITRSLVPYVTIEQLTLVGASNINGTGNNLANILTGNAANNILDGGLGNDTLNGLGGSDVLVGNAGKDTSTGSAGNDIFRFAAAVHSVGANADIIKDFDDLNNDSIDLRSVFGGVLTYRHNGQVRINDIAGADVIVEVNTGGSLAADMHIRLTATTLASMTASDFLL
jgi:serralysin